MTSTRGLSLGRTNSVLKLAIFCSAFAAGAGSCAHSGAAPEGQGSPSISAPQSLDGFRAATKVRRYLSADGVELHIVPLIPTTDGATNRALVRFTGTTSRHYDGAVFLVDVDESNGKIDYRWKYEGAPYVIVTSREDAWGGLNIEGYVPDLQSEVRFRVADAAAALDPQVILKAYQSNPR